MLLCRYMCDLYREYPLSDATLPHHNRILSFSDLNYILLFVNSFNKCFKLPPSALSCIFSLLQSLLEGLLILWGFPDTILSTVL